jgi:hypothetical protein
MNAVGALPGDIAAWIRGVLSVVVWRLPAALLLSALVAAHVHSRGLRREQP